ncbi:mRNA turnover protein 4 homolog isoform X1 [Phymastichus coffea]|uniref:mRNA turnover protein 4 homolog isoform X1 n=1 Tax=Phymastichus coffea TaxID=108790 RepID=UPI00273C22E9|nr:mRNA turnover protein 4 homolog isoform X1 [Phymastichus coffea]
MPKLKRDKKISLTKTKKKGLELKQQIVNDVRSCVEQFKTIILFSVDNMRNNKLKEIREEWKGSRFFFGKNKIVALALGKTLETEISEGLSKLSVRLEGQCGLFFTNENKNKVLKWMKEFEENDYARAGFVATKTVRLSAGPLPDFSHAIEPHLRVLGMPTTLDKGIVTLLKEYTVCKQGQALTPESARILKLLGIPLATFKLTPIGVYTKKHGYKDLAKSNTEEETEEKMEEQ